MAGIGEDVEAVTRHVLLPDKSPSKSSAVVFGEEEGGVVVGKYVGGWGGEERRSLEEYNVFSGEILLNVPYDCCL